MNTDEPIGEFLLYTTEDGKTRVECRFENETLWLSQALMGELFDRDVRTINEHLKNLYEEEELSASATIRKFRIVRMEGTREVKREIEHYNLEAILAVGFRVKSPRGTQFRRWANTRLQEYLVKGFTMDDERLKNPDISGTSAVPDYFDEMLARIRDIRASERRVYLRVREIFALAADYEPTRKDTTQFFRIIQNKLHFAATGKTAAELIAERADASQPNMGLTVWKGEVVRKSDVTVAKNYLQQEEIDELNRIVVMWLDFAEDQAKRRKQVFLKQWQEKLNDFLRFNDREVLPDAGSVSKSEADEKAAEEYALFEERRRKALEEKGAAESIEHLEAIAGSADVPVGLDGEHDADEDVGVPSIEDDADEDVGVPSIEDDADEDVGVPRGWYSRGYLPHLDAAGLLQSITFRLADSLPQEKLKQLEEELAAKPKEVRSVQHRKRIEEWLDAGMGCCALGHPEVAAYVENALLHFDGERYALLAWCIMPNHVHVLIEPLASTPLASIVQGWKAYTGRWALDQNEFLDLRIPSMKHFWMRDYWDRYVRDDAHRGEVIRYIHENPVKAKLCARAEDWRWSSARRVAGREGGADGDVGAPGNGHNDADGDVGVPGKS